MSSGKLDWTNAEQANGRKLLAWCQENAIDFYHGDLPSKWRGGRNPQIETVDKLMVHNYRHICELPDDIWMKPKKPLKTKNGRFTKSNG